ncbi:hypothetical protein [uncultured Microbacterium sp.]|uniref:hypothetical protein n=1 Tax=uncultured Microbacterium sp. TaxID=191216 RepID=UPI0025E2B145|nr:hypothetical protein [uncultured Microbacterium sp.]
MRIIDAVRRTDRPDPVVLIDGRSGAGKSTLARRLADRWPLAAPAQLVALDAIYPGWDGLAEGAERARAQILHPHRQGVPGTWRRYDWATGEYAESHTVDPGRGVILEGCGALTPGSSRDADVRVWIDAPEPSRRGRALDRDGDLFRPHWRRWAAQEDKHLQDDDPIALADLVIRVP